MELRTLTHWLGWTTANDTDQMQMAKNMRQYVRGVARQEMGHLGVKLIGRGQMERVTAQRPYSLAFKIQPHGLRVNLNPKLPHILWSASGSACESLHQAGLLQLVIESVASDVTRIDLAVDARTAMTPAQFLAHGISERIKTEARHKSETGWTEYRGSWTSDRSLKVYRYFPPHIRHEWLRIEIRYGGKRAKRIAEAHREASTAQIVAAEVRDLKLEGAAAWPIAAAPHKVDNWQPERSEHKTELWLRTQVFSAFHRLVAEGVIDNPAAYLQEHFLDRLGR